MNEPIQKLTRADFSSDQEVRWCPGCGDYAILAAMQRVLPDLGIEKENLVFISGIGCSGRFPYYMDCYGFHTIHGRAPAVATGLQLTRPELSVWLVTGDGDALSIGANHLLHILRRNVDVNILLLNNRIYGLTKGQFSPTSEQGKVTKTSPLGSIAKALDPISLALTVGATFVGRGLDVDAKGLQTLFKAAIAHKGTSFIEIYQNCNIFNDGTFAAVSDKKTRAANTLHLRSGQPLLFGENNEKAIVRKDGYLSVADAASTDALIFDTNDTTTFLAEQLARTTFPEFPVPMGIFRQITQPSYGAVLQEKLSGKENFDLHKLLHQGNTWKVGEGS